MGMLVRDWAFLLTQGVTLRWHIFPFQGKQITLELKIDYPEGVAYVSDG